MQLSILEKDLLACCGSNRFAKQMAPASPFSSFQVALSTAQDIWFNKVDVNGWLEAFSAHPQIGEIPSSNKGWSKGEQSTALSTATGSSLQELSEWNIRYREKFGFVFLIRASGRSTDDILSELKRRYKNRPIVEFEITAQEQMKITELRLGELFLTKENASSTTDTHPAVVAKKEDDCVNIIVGNISASSEVSAGKSYSVPTQTRPPITTHVLDVSRGSPAAGIEIRLEMWKDTLSRPAFGETDIGRWVFQGSSTTDEDGRGEFMSMVDAVNPGIYRISFNTGKYRPSGFFPYVSVVFEIRESQRLEHFHVPLLLSPFSFTTCRGS
ncbi:Uric acid degradation bifunctional protein TTL [Quillaja saponaria]|uniref:Uric acid degradation bifunctional protein TTL n=1 Tax=Quillaja saponaria TaxID=32244 RepID=A0AAD7PR72_QUISA|nr:Uric acid degradation bifunctional protein TTL [Quillaja saponaria]